MEYLFYLLYVVVVGQFFISKPKKNVGYPKGRSFYKMSGIINLIFGIGGMIGGVIAIAIVYVVVPILLKIHFDFAWAFMIAGLFTVGVFGLAKKTNCGGNDYEFI